MTSEIDVRLGANEHFEGRPYRVRLHDNGAEPQVWAVIHRSPVNPRGFYQTDTVYRTIKPGSANFKAAVKAAQAAGDDEAPGPGVRYRDYPGQG